MSHFKISYPIVFDPTGGVTLRFRGFAPRGFPYTIVLDRRGRVAVVYPVALLRQDIPAGRDQAGSRAVTVGPTAAARWRGTPRLAAADDPPTVRAGLMLFDGHLDEWLDVGFGALLGPKPA